MCLAVCVHVCVCFCGTGCRDGLETDMVTGEKRSVKHFFLRTPYGLRFILTIWLFLVRSCHWTCWAAHFDFFCWKRFVLPNVFRVLKPNQAAISFLWWECTRKLPERKAVDPEGPKLAGRSPKTGLLGSNWVFSFVPLPNSAVAPASSQSSSRV